MQYQIDVTGLPDIERFLIRIGGLGASKSVAALQVLERVQATKPNTNRDVVPLEAWRMYAVPAMTLAGVTTRALQAELGNAYCGSALYKVNLSRERAARVAQITGSAELSQLATSDVYWDRVASIDEGAVEPVYDMTVPGLHNFVADDIVVHNSIEQDSDVVAFIYRDSYYRRGEEGDAPAMQPDDPDFNKTELIVAKHRNGPTGDVVLRFQSKYTRFRDDYRQTRSA
jgi:replicative DNA helicase